MDSEQSSLFSIGIDEVTQSHFISIAKWNKFLAISGIICSGLTELLIIVGGRVLVSGFAGLSNNPLQSNAVQTGVLWGMLVFYSICVAVFLIPCFFRLNFANRMLKAIAGNDQQLLNDSLKQLKTYSIYWGIVTIIGLAMYLLFFAGVLVSILTTFK